MVYHGPFAHGSTVPADQTPASRSRGVPARLRVDKGTFPTSGINAELMLNSVTSGVASLGTKSANFPQASTVTLPTVLPPAWPVAPARTRPGCERTPEASANIGAVRAGLLNVLITDEDTAAEMLGILKGEEASTDLDARPA